MSDELNRKVESYYSARREYEALKKASNEADKDRRAREQELVDYMLEHQLIGFDREDGTHPSLVNSVTISSTKENADAVRMWLIATVGDDKDYIETLPNKWAVLELVKKKIKEEKIDPSEFPAFLKVDTRPTLRVTGWKGVSEES